MKTSIQTRFTVFILALVAMMMALAIAAVVSLATVEEKFESVDEKWLASTGMLGELADRLSEFRLAETYRALAVTEADRVEAERLAMDHRAAIGTIFGNYLRLNSEIGGGDLKRVISTWNDYLKVHDQWIRNDRTGEFKDPARYKSLMHQLYIETDRAVNRVIKLNTQRAHAEADAVNHAVENTIRFVAVICLCGIGIAAWLLRRVRKTIAQPIAGMTEALSRLARGDRKVVVPELDRDDEVGELAKAFEVFRANALALEQAHEETRVAQEEAQSMARHDALTGLPNRRLFGAELRRFLGRSAADRSEFALLMIDLDRFKPVNDMQGHAVGDAVLCEVAERLKTSIGKADVAARLGGDEFAVIVALGDGGGTEAGSRSAQKLLAAISEPIHVGESIIEIGASIGLAFAPSDGSDPEDLLRAADLAMYRAKKDGRGRVRFFEAAMDDEMRVQAGKEADLRAAIASSQIKPFYQPLINIRQGRIYGFEMLARWHHPTHGDVRPDVFIPLAEQLGLISDLTWSLLRTACRDASAWDRDISLSINVSPLQLNEPEFPLHLLAILNEEGFDPARLEVEVTESAFLTDIGAARQTLSTLQGLGIKIALDDFGTGYSSLSHLRELKFDKIKIDRSFVQTIHESAENQKIVSAILSLADSLDLPTVAEGIETGTVMKQLEDMGCELGQGYLFGKAVPAEAVPQLLNHPVLIAR
jgi:diguanylate cyclase (GGDEF)-like protein